ncbi:hemerythrin domain-containing protein [Rubrivivax gelatinosus]|uniref:Hemerythrin-like domain-containing protein n=2 Tax=Rubrivivax gelatinosus TaxID=28068 RepID=A0ABS1DMX8_RUBGE|nr:hypothetical protein [Rubrivivax gelatinosus]
MEHALPEADDAVVMLVAQHRRLEELLRRLHAAEQPDARAQALVAVGDELTMHVLAEERVFYPAVAGARTEDVLLESLEEHLSLKRLLADLLDLDPADATFGAKAHVLQEQCVHHHGEEEEHLFPQVVLALPKARRQELGHEMLREQGRLRRDGAPRDVVREQTDAAEPLRPD